MSEQKHLLIAGGGSAAFAGAYEALDRGARVTMFNQGLPLGGTCPNVGCVPSKTLIRAAETVHRHRDRRFRGIHTEGRVDDFREVIEQKRELIRNLVASNYEEVVPRLNSFRLEASRARVAGPRAVTCDSGRVEGDGILLATGTRPFVPPLEGLAESGFITSDTAFELDRLPASLVVLGGGYIALECAQMFARFGSRVTVLQRSGHVLSDQPGYLGLALADHLREEGMEVVCGVSVESAARGPGGIELRTAVDGRPRTFEAERVLVATGRRPNTDDVGLAECGIATGPDGYVLVDEALQTSVPGIYAAGDVIGDPQFVYTASYEAELAVRNFLGPNRVKRDYTALPWVIFTDPQVAGVGFDEEQAAARGFDVGSAVLPADRWPRFRVAHDTRGFLRLIRDRATDRLLGARILAPEGGDLVTELGLAIRHGLTTTELAETFHPYLTLSEGIQRAAQRFPRQEIVYTREEDAGP